MNKIVLKLFSCTYSLMFTNYITLSFLFWGKIPFLFRTSPGRGCKGQGRTRVMVCAVESRLPAIDAMTNDSAPKDQIKEMSQVCRWEKALLEMFSRYKYFLFKNLKGYSENCVWMIKLFLMAATIGKKSMVFNTWINFDFEI